MTSNYMPIPTDSDDEGNNMPVTAPTSDHDGYSDRSRSPDRVHLFSQATADSDEEEPEEDPEEEPEENNPRNPSPQFLQPINPPGIRVYTRRTARKRVAMPPTWTRIRSPEPTVPVTDPYVHSSSSSQGWGRTLDTLREWNKAGRFQSIFNRGEPSAGRYEPILDTTPIIVDQMVIHENRLDLIEDGMMEMPGGDAFNELQEQVNNVEGNMSEVYDTVQSLRAQLESNTKSLNEMSLTMQGRMDYCQTMADSAMAQVSYMIIPEDYYKRKEDGKEDKE